MGMTLWTSVGRRVSFGGSFASFTHRFLVLHMIRIIISIWYCLFFSIFLFSRCCYLWFDSFLFAQRIESVWMWQISSSCLAFRLSLSLCVHSTFLSRLFLHSYSNLFLFLLEDGRDQRTSLYSHQMANEKSTGGGGEQQTRGDITMRWCNEENVPRMWVSSITVNKRREESVGYAAEFTFEAHYCTLNFGEERRSKEAERSFRSVACQSR